jgi:hypothetical protein
MSHEPKRTNPEITTGPSQTSTPTLSVRNSRCNTQSSNAPFTSPQTQQSSAIRSDSSQPVIVHIDQVLEMFRNKTITKAKALSLVFHHLKIRPDQNEPEKEKAFELYTNTIDSISSLTAKATDRGSIVSGLSGGANARDSRHDEVEPSPAVNLNASIDHQIDELVSNHSRGIGRDREDKSGGESEGEDVRSNKRQRVKESDMPWYEREVSARQSGNPSCQKSS